MPDELEIVDIVCFDIPQTKKKKLRMKNVELKSAYSKCEECGREVLLGVQCKNPKTGICDLHSNYFKTEKQTPTESQGKAQILNKLFDEHLAKSGVMQDELWLEAYHLIMDFRKNQEK